ncbi:hypothetical protein ACHAQJ_000123 [Trichoderma viride]
MPPAALRRRLGLKADPDQEKQLPQPPADQPSDEDLFYSIWDTPPPTSDTCIPQDEAWKLQDLEDELEARRATTSFATQADTPPPNPYPLSQQVLGLEKREQEAQAKCTLLEEKYRQLRLAMERLTKERDKERFDHEARCKSLEAANEAALKQIEKEKDKFKELNAKNESLVADLAAASEEKTRLSEMLEEKTHESYVFRCACCILFKVAPSTSERVTIRNLLRDVLLHYIDKRKREHEDQENQVQDQSNEGQLAEPRPQQESSPCVAISDAAESDVGSENLSLGRKRPRTRSGEEIVPDDWLQSCERASDDDTDEDMPLTEVRKKRAKKSKDHVIVS